MEKSDIEKRRIGVVTPIGALRGEKSAGIGEFADLPEFAQAAKEMDIGLIQLLPVNDTGYESSPYFALSAFALNPVYIRLSDLPESDAFKAKIGALRKTFESETRFPYSRVAKAKITLLREMYEARADQIAKDSELNRWIKANPWVPAYAVYRALKDENGMKSWKEWKSSQKLNHEIDSLWNNTTRRKDYLFWAWAQYHLDKQFLRAAKEVKKLGIILEGDIPILMNEDSADVWANPSIFIQELSAGAPPDMYSPGGQNWGFPIYNWEAQEKNKFAWWRERLAVAERYYEAYRIDHVLGFFRIWSTSRANDSAALGRFVESQPVKHADLKALGLPDSRVLWLTQPHIPSAELRDAVRGGGGSKDDAERAFGAALERIGGEELWLFKKEISGERDIQALPIHQAAKNYLCLAWANRVFLEYAPGLYAPLWYFRNSRAYTSLSAAEKTAIEKLIAKKAAASEKDWEAQGLKLLKALQESSAMLPCAEDLGAVPSCVPKTLAKLKILGLRVTRWHRRWDVAGEPYVPFDEYPELSVCTPAVHDSSTVREWWEKEAGQEAFAHFLGAPALPKVYNPGTARIVLKAAAQAASRFRVFQMQDLLHLSPKWYADDPASERVNVPGTCNDFNWTWRFPAPVSEILRDTELVAAVKELAALKKTDKQKGKPART